VAQDGEALDVEHRELSLIEREGVAGEGGDAEAREDARARPENSSSAWGGYFAFSGNAWQRLQSSGARFLSETMSVVLAASPDT